MRRRSFVKAATVLLPIFTFIGVANISRKTDAQNVRAVRGEIKRFKNYKNHDIEIEEGGDLDALGFVRVRLSRKNGHHPRDIEIQKRGNKKNKAIYTSGLFPFGEEFSTLDQLVEDIVDLGVLDT